MDDMHHTIIRSFGHIKKRKLNGSLQMSSLQYTWCRIFYGLYMLLMWPSIIWNDWQTTPGTDSGKVWLPQQPALGLLEEYLLIFPRQIRQIDNLLLLKQTRVCLNISYFKNKWIFRHQEKHSWISCTLFCLFCFTEILC